MHLACALLVRTIAIFLKNNFDHWGPPPGLARIVHRAEGVTAKDVLEASLLELPPFSPAKTRRIVNA